MVVISEKLLKNYHLMVDSDVIEIRDILLDLDTAIQQAELTELEMAVIKATYFSLPVIPLRTGKPGRPKHAGPQGLIALELSEMLRKDLDARGRKITGQTEYHDLHRSIKQYKKVLQRALDKIEKALNYGGTVELSASSLRNMPAKYITQV